MLDLVLRNGTIFDGTGNPWYYADVGIKDGKCAAVGKFDYASATEVIDVAGLAVSPGFIDIHTHTELGILADPEMECKIKQGVTTEFYGQSAVGGPNG